VEVAPPQGIDFERLKRRIRLALEDEIGEQRVDLVLDDGSSADTRPSISLFGVES
jgi:hypothetical protein